MNDILVRGEEARRRRSKKRRLQPEEMTVDPSVRLRSYEPADQVRSRDLYVIEFLQNFTFQ